MPTTRKANSNTSTQLIGCMEGSKVLLWINRWIGHVTRTKHRDTRLECRASESKKCQMGREKRARLKRWSKNTRRTCRCSHHHESAYPRRSKILQQTTDATLTTTAKESAWSCEDMHDMIIMMQCKLSKLSGIGIPAHTYMVQVVLLHDNLNVD
jgi:hypothetical protein